MTEFLTQTSWLIPIYGLIGAILTLLWATGLIQRTGPRPAAYFNLLMTILACIHGGLVFSEAWNQPVRELVFHWLQVGDLDISLVLEISPVSTGAMEVVTSLSLLAQLYALGYMEKDWALARFFALMGFFEGAMSGIVLSNSLFLTYALLETLTVSTYLLVGFWYAQPLVVTAARDAFLTKRVGDVLLLMGVVALATLSGSVNFNDLYDWAGTANLPPLTATLLGLALIAGPLGKCAQFPLHLWLDEAMEGPNPASVLRNSLVVCCGAYVLIKLLPILALSPVTLSVLVAIGTVTAIGASFVAIAQIDIKRSLSHTTSAYLGLVFIAVGTGRADVATALLLAHAFAKALLFMSTGSIILTTSNQNLTEMGGLWSRMPATTSAFVVGTAGMIGLLPLGGYWALSKGINAFWGDYPFLVATFLLVNGITALGLTRVFRLVFLGKPQPKTRRAPEVMWPMASAMVALAILNLGMPVLLQGLSLLPPSKYEYLVRVPQLVLFGSSLLGCVVGASVYLPRTGLRSISLPVRFLQDLLAYDFYVDRFYRLTFVLAVDSFSKITAWIDQNIVDGVVNLVGLVTVFGGQTLKYNVSGKSQFYLLTILLGISLLALLMSWPLSQWSFEHWSLIQGQ
ncbi:MULTISPECIES: NAD(P)H-quinone oxidoreductase subunit F [unclassified Coleofasciculus]|uniref:NAD(P)H-quinone oxidoreductase subunit F n=1 Tax=unclassified Coleofasciculus TaxID=2692782 RepID=UPI00187E1F35|nr:MULTISPECIES: NAD(P)H-quinone oxidoreductase subunit F [unclassified Coleofasciculus]MBE9126024.1 NAD(P)H-quinone oxidoreductase subunit F [Coleofasciculus sp. LEGE 07081]MBE9148712.1 NAD(P)H-quinone oxidoreductase subunit F [Coleofasciculus sp. LEGE 07092]